MRLKMASCTGHAQDPSYDFIDKLSKILASQVEASRQSFEHRIGQMLNRHEERLLQLLNGHCQGCGSHQRSFVISSLRNSGAAYQAGLQVNQEDLQHLSSESTAANRSFELPVAVERVLCHSPTSFDGLEEQAVTTDDAEYIDSSNTPDETVLERDISELTLGKGKTVQRRFSIDGLLKTYSNKILRTGTGESRPVERLAWWQDLDDPSSSTVAAIYSSLMNPIIFISVTLSVFSRFDPPIFPNFNGEWLGWVQISFDVLFTLEFIFRFVVAFSKLNFMLEPFNVIDFLASMPLLILDGFDGFSPEQISSNDGPLAKQIVRGLGPVFKVCKILRRFPTFQLLTSAFADAMEALPVLMFVFFLIGLTFASLLYAVECDHPSYVADTSITTFQEAIWLTIITMTTVGYGDFSPKTTSGRVLVGCLVVIQVLYMALPLGILGQEFTNIWRSRHQVLAMKRVRTRLKTLGLGYCDLPELFKQFGNADGAIDFESFSRLCHALNMNMRARQMEELYRSFDEDMGGNIDALEFAASVFPKEYKTFLDLTHDRSHRPPRRSTIQSDWQRQF